MTPTFTLKSSELGGQLNQEQYSNVMGFTGLNRSPQLYWENAPKDAMAFALTMHDLDAPTGSGFWHWVVFNIPPDIHELPSDAGNPEKKLMPGKAIQSDTDMGKPGFAGAAPPEGPAHRYLITIHALTQEIELNQNATPAYVGFILHYNTLAKASLLVYEQKY